MGLAQALRAVHYITILIRALLDFAVLSLNTIMPQMLWHNGSTSAAHLCHVSVCMLGAELLPALHCYIDLLLQILMSVSQGPLVVSRTVPTHMAASSAAVGVDTPSTQIAGHAQVA